MAQLLPNVLRIQKNSLLKPKMKAEFYMWLLQVMKSHSQKNTSQLYYCSLLQEYGGEFPAAEWMLVEKWELRLTAKPTGG